MPGYRQENGQIISQGRVDHINRIGALGYDNNKEIAAYVLEKLGDRAFSNDFWFAYRTRVDEIEAAKDNSVEILFSSQAFEHPDRTKSLRYHLGQDGSGYRYAVQMFNDRCPGYSEESNEELSKTLNWSKKSFGSSSECIHEALKEKEAWSRVKAVLREPGKSFEPMSPYDLVAARKDAPSTGRGGR